jgi:hypothetical protein
MIPNFWIYSNNKEQGKTATELIVFGAEIFKRAKSIEHIERLKEIKQDLDNKRNPPNDLYHDFIFEYLIDSIRFLIFFENYMKAELILNNFCVHIIKRNHPGFKYLAKEQSSRPIKLEEINKIENFVIDPINKIIHHPAITAKTIGIRELIATEQYYSNYAFDLEILEIIIKFNLYRNQLHFNASIEYQLSEEYISSLIKMNDFVDQIVKNRIINNVALK